MLVGGIDAAIGYANGFAPIGGEEGFATRNYGVALLLYKVGGIVFIFGNFGGSLRIKIEASIAEILLLPVFKSDLTSYLPLRIGANGGADL